MRLELKQTNIKFQIELMKLPKNNSKQYVCLLRICLEFML